MNNPAKPDFDYLIAGGGCAGLSLLYALLQSPLSGRKILVADREQKTKNDRTWSFWADSPTPFDHLAVKSWRQIEFLSDNFQQTSVLEKFTYRTIRGADFYQAVYQLAADRANVCFVQGEITELRNTDDHVEITVGGQRYTAAWAFDSLYDPTRFHAAQPGYHFILQHFKGYVIRTEASRFDPEKITLHDFRTEQKDGAFFFYVLPFAPNRALVEYTGFSKQLLPRPEYEAELRDYIHNTLKISDYEIEEEEFGAIPMTDFPFARQTGRIVKIGVQGGQAKPSTGYAFYRIQQQTAQLVRALVTTGRPPASKPSRQFIAFDSLLLNILHRNGPSIKAIFTQLFAKNPIERVLRFLNETTTPFENLLIMASVPAKPFLISIKNVFLSGRLVK
ncbi:MAG: lycopene cyclase family protein [Bernardetiaceae bacterium]|jgi:lycopene beta-cyclase|nr:lycopene cyclase family protein [Bernardetiaceae bacterium]